MKLNLLIFISLFLTIQSFLQESNVISNGIDDVTLAKEYTTAVDSKKNFRRGTIPDFNVNPTLEEWIAKDDIELTSTINFIKKHSK